MASEPGVFRPVARKISQDITVDSSKKIQFRDTGIYLQSDADGSLTVSSDGAIKVTGGLTHQAETLTSNDTVSSSTTLLLADPSPAPGSAIVASVSAPTSGRELFISNTSSSNGPQLHVVLNSGTWDGTNGTATFGTAGQTLHVIGTSATRFRIVSNPNSVIFPN